MSSTDFVPYHMRRPRSAQQRRLLRALVSGAACEVPHATLMSFWLRGWVILGHCDEPPQLTDAGRRMAQSLAPLADAPAPMRRRAAR